jgi:hypothetical protein
MAFGTRPDEQRQQDEVLSKVDALLRRHRGGGLDAALAGREDMEIPTLTEVIEEPESPAAESVASEAVLIEPAAGESADAGAEPAPKGGTARDAHPAVQSTEPALDQEWLARLTPEIERAVADALAARLPQAIHEQVMPEVMLQLGEGLNRLRDAMSSTVRGVVQETIEQEVKRALKALLKERMRR